MTYGDVMNMFGYVKANYQSIRDTLKGRIPEEDIVTDKEFQILEETLKLSKQKGGTMTEIKADIQYLEEENRNLDIRIKTDQAELDAKEDLIKRIQAYPIIEVKRT